MHYNDSGRPLYFEIKEDENYSFSDFALIDDNEYDKKWQNEYALPR